MGIQQTSNRLIVLAFCLTALACNQQSNTKKDFHVHFSTNDFIKGQITALTSSKTILSKDIQKDGGMETQHIIIPEWPVELQPFIDSDINKPALKDSYRKDSLMMDSNKTIIYSAIDSGGAVKHLVIYYTGQEISKLQVHIYKKNNLYTSSRTMEYTVNKGYSIVGYQKVRFLKPLTYQVVGTFSH